MCCWFTICFAILKHFIITFHHQTLLQYISFIRTQKFRFKWLQNICLLLLKNKCTHIFPVLAPVKHNCLLKTFLRTLILMTQVSLYLFSLIELLWNCIITVKKIITSFDLSKTSGPYCIPVVVLKNCEPKLSYILTQLSIMCLRESCFPDCWKVLTVVPVFKACVHYFLSNFYFSPNDSPLKTTKNVFYFN